MVKWLVLGTLRNFLGLIVVLTVAGCTYAATFIPASAEGRLVLMAVGFVGGLLVSALMFGLVYLLFDIADNTREMTELLRAQQGRVDGIDIGNGERERRQAGQRIEPRL